MKAIQFSEFGGYDRLALTEQPIPSIGDGQSLVRMRYAAVTPLDDTIRSGVLPYDLPLPLVPGGTALAEVVEAGTSGLKVGTRVLIGGRGLGMTQDGTWREYMSVDSVQLTPIPEGLSDESVIAAVTGAGYLTAYLSLTELASFAPGQTVLSPGIGGSVGLGTVEIAKALGSPLAISTASRTDKAERGRADGHEVIDLSKESLSAGVRRLTDGRGVDVVVDGVGGPFTGEALSVLAPGGRLVVVGYSGGKHADVNVTDIIWRSARIFGFMFTQFSPETLLHANQRIFELLHEGALKPMLARTFSLEEAAEATRYLIEDRPYGRVVLGFGGESR